ncbi:MAG: symmetrical bis(5'-nucleosyl)-tetraphosphatase [Gammaproteobacteria bacterium]|nr:MAG: symmetrical bis(5'-nucleosyl)-tetraphosphatase [Gammaproteobacteria bacterium]
MAIYAIGDVQGCYHSLKALLGKINFKPGRDTLWFTGDLVNRGSHSLEVLRLVADLDEHAVTVLGNHDLHLLAVASGARKPSRNDTFTDVLDAADSAELLAWLQQRPLIHHDVGKRLTLVHAGIYPGWSLTQAKTLAAEVSSCLTGDGAKDFFTNMYGNQPAAWDPGLIGWDRLRFITNSFTRMRYCDRQGILNLDEKGAPGTQAPGLVPWFEHPRTLSHNSFKGGHLLFGHWATLPVGHFGPAISLDGGCLWGGSLTALKCEGDLSSFTSVACPIAQAPAR